MGGEYVAVQLQQAQPGMVDRLALLFVDADTTRSPQTAKPRAGVAQIGDQLGEAVVTRIPAKARPEIGGDRLLVLALIDSGNARLRRDYLGRVTGASRLLSCHLLYQTDAVRDAIIAAAESSLDLREHRVLFPEDMTGWREGTLVWRTPDLELRMHVRQAHTLVTPLGGADAPRRGRETREAIAVRRGEVAAFLSAEDTSQLALVEIDPRKTFTKRTSDRSSRPASAARTRDGSASSSTRFLWRKAAERARRRTLLRTSPSGRRPPGRTACVSSA